VDVVINATDMVRGSRFSFRQVELDYLCSDLSGIPIARAVAASAAFPGPLTPVILHNYAGTCGFEAPSWIDQTLAARGPSRRRLRQAEILDSYLDASRPYVYLLDGGISDNLGVRAIIERTVGEGSFRRLLEWAGLEETRQILMIVVNAETERELEQEGRMLKAGFAGLIGTVSGIQIRSFNFETIELMRTSFDEWAQQLSERHGAPVEFRLVDLHFDRIGDPDLRRKLKNLPTSLSLDDEAVDRLRAAGRELLRSSPEFREALGRIRGLAPEAPAGPPAQP
jgi:NTE family protein